MGKKLFYLLKYKIYWIRYCYPFLMLHKPLCKQFQQDVIIFFDKLFFCRSCFFVYFGLILSLIWALSQSLELSVQCFIPLFLFVFIFSYPKLYNKFGRRIKDIVRFFNGVMIGAIIVLGVRGQLFFSILMLLGLFGIKKIYNIQRAKNAKDACVGCEELQHGRVCRGYKRQITEMLAFEEAFYGSLSDRSSNYD